MVSASNVPHFYIQSRDLREICGFLKGQRREKRPKHAYKTNSKILKSISYWRQTTHQHRGNAVVWCEQSHFEHVAAATRKTYDKVG